MMALGYSVIWNADISANPPRTWPLFISEDPAGWDVLALLANDQPMGKAGNGLTFWWSPFLVSRCYFNRPQQGEDCSADQLTSRLDILKRIMGTAFDPALILKPNEYGYTSFDFLQRNMGNEPAPTPPDVVQDLLWTWMTKTSFPDQYLAWRPVNDTSCKQVEVGLPPPAGGFAASNKITKCDDLFELRH